MPEPILRIPKRTYLVMSLFQTKGHEECVAFRAQRTTVFDILDRVDQNKSSQALPPQLWNPALRLLGMRIGFPSELKRSYGRGSALAPRVVAVGVSMSGTG